MNDILEETLDDYIEESLDILSIGLNPSPPSVAAGVYFVGKRNRFWKALNGSGLTRETLDPSRESMMRLLQEYRIGFTDTVKRPTPGAADLRKADFKRDVPVLHEKILRYQPRIAWFHGKIAYGQFASILGLDCSPLDWGKQPVKLGKSMVFVSPNPSPANAAFSLEELIQYYRLLKADLDQGR